jgi:hypothetical protein
MRSQKRGPSPLRSKGFGSAKTLFRYPRAGGQEPAYAGEPRNAPGFLPEFCTRRKFPS